jgi:methylated-DNA-protein-cysteine methyltransferase-like protein
VRRVPKGNVVTYGDVAGAIALPCSPRFVGGALGRAHPALGLPWHRVLAAGGRIALPGHAGEEQRLRLKAEGVQFAGARVRMDLHHYTKLSRRSKPASRASRRKSLQ